MKILIADSRKNTKYYGETESTPIPRIGEKVYIGYNPPPVVTDVIYIKDPDNSVYVCVDGFVM